MKKFHKRSKRAFKPGAFLVLNSNGMASLLASALNTASTVSGLHSSIGRKGHSLQVYTTEIQWKITGSKNLLEFLMKVLPEDGIKVHFILLWIRINFLFQCYKSSLNPEHTSHPKSIIPTILDVLTKKTNVEWINRPVTQTTRCTSPMRQCTSL